MKNNKVIAETVSEQWRHQALVNAWPPWTDARRQYILLRSWFRTRWSVKRDWTTRSTILNMVERLEIGL